MSLRVPAVRIALPLCLLFLSIPSGALAQVNVSAVRGTVLADDGVPIEWAEVTLIHEPSSNRKVTRTNESGEFAFTGLRVGGPYSVTVNAPGFVPQGLGNIHLTAGKRARVRLRLVPAGEVIHIEGSTTPTSTSQKLTFGSGDIEELPTVGRDPKDIVKLMPEAYLDGGDSAMSIGGANNRFNSVTIDGIRQDDDFGLNGNGYPTQRSPIALSAVEEISVERSPFDVRYGNFLGGNVNIVTKSGTNEFHGSLISTFANQGLQGNKTGDDELDVEFREIRYGVTLGGPIVRDKLHFLVSVEGLDAASPSSVGPEGSGASNEVAGITQDDVDRVREIARDVYGFDAGVPSQTLNELDLKILSKIDWAINDSHRLSGKYQRTGGNSIRDSGAFNMELPLTSNWFDRKDTLNAFSVRLFSDWTPQLSTEVEVSGKIVDTQQVPLNGRDFPAAEIATEGGGTIIIGPDPFRHANELDNNLIHGKLEANYLHQKHLFTGGFEYDRFSVFNLFVPYSNGEARYSSIDNFRLMMPDSLRYDNSITNDADDAAANWGYGTLTAFLQDQYEISPELTVQGGARFEVYHASDNIDRNQIFVDRYGFDNTATINGRWIAMPRLGVTYRPIDRLNLRGGAGLYSGGTPNVWISNNYTNDGVSIDSARSSDPAAIAGFNGKDIPSVLTGDLRAGDGNVDALDPDFKIPSSWKVAGGADYTFVVPVIGDLGVEANYSFSKVNNGLQWMDLRRDLTSIDNNTPVGRLPDGRFYYDDFTDVAPFEPERGFDMLLTNTDRGRSHTASLAVNKGFSSGLSLYGAYAYQNVTELSPATSSRSVSNYGLAAVADPNNPKEGRSNYERRHRLISAVRFSRPVIADLFGPGSVWKDMKTTLSVFVESRAGQPYSYTFGGDRNDLARLFGEELEFARRNRHRFYVPKGDGSDVTLDGIDEGELNAFLQDTGLDKYRGQIAPRNAFSSKWLHRVDLRFAQALPLPMTTGFAPGSRARFLLDIQNLGNLLNSDWGQAKQVPFPYLVPVVDVNVDPVTNKYVYSNLRTDDPERVNLLASLWRIQLSLMVEF